MKVVAAALLLVTPYLVFLMFWWRYARHYEPVFRLPNIADVLQAWALAPLVGNGRILRWVVATVVTFFYAGTVWQLTGD